MSLEKIHGLQKEIIKLKMARDSWRWENGKIQSIYNFSANSVHVHMYKISCKSEIYYSSIFNDSLAVHKFSRVRLRNR